MVALVASCVPATAPRTRVGSSVYEDVQIDEHHVHVNAELREHPSERSRMLELLSARLANADAWMVTLSSATRARMLRIPVWVEWARRDDSASEYHRSATWLAAHGEPTEKAKAIEISNTRHFLAWAADQPMLVMHELAHALLDIDDAWLRSTVAAAL